MVKKRRARRKNPGNYVKPTGLVAKKHVDAWKKLGITTPKQIKVGIKAPRNIKLTDTTKANIAKVRLREALVVVDQFDKATKAYEAKMSDYADKLSEWKQAKKAGTEMQKPTRPSKPSGKSRGTGRSGNFLTVTKPQAINYLKRVFRWNSRLKDRDQAYINSAVKGGSIGWLAAKKRAGYLQAGVLGSRLQEALMVVGSAEAGVILRKAQSNALKHAERLQKKAEVAAIAKAKRESTTKTRLTKKLGKLVKQAEKSKEGYDKKYSELTSKISKLRSVSARSRKSRRLKKSRKRLRRNPAKKAKRSMKRCKKAKKRCRSKKTRRSKSKSR